MSPTVSLTSTVRSDKTVHIYDFRFGQLLLLLLYCYGRFTARDYPGGPVPEETFTHLHLKSSISVAGGLSSFWILSGVGKIIEASAPTVWLDATLSGPSMPPPPSSPQFYAGCPSCRNPPNLSWLGTGTKYAALHTWRFG